MSKIVSSLFEGAKQALHSVPTGIVTRRASSLAQRSEIGVSAILPNGFVDILGGGQEHVLNQLKHSNLNLVIPHLSGIEHILATELTRSSSKKGSVAMVLFFEPGYLLSLQDAMMAIGRGVDEIIVSCNNLGSNGAFSVLSEVFKYAQDCGVRTVAHFPSILYSEENKDHSDVEVVSDNIASLSEKCKPSKVLIGDETTHKQNPDSRAEEIVHMTNCVGGKLPTGTQLAVNFGSVGDNITAVNTGKVSTVETGFWNVVAQVVMLARSGYETHDTLQTIQEITSFYKLFTNAGNYVSETGLLDLFADMNPSEQAKLLQPDNSSHIVATNLSSDSKNKGDDDRGSGR